ncbi:alpha/beta hydrolase [Lactobacillus sp. ESL0228]|uniref:alpha/beta hydrolase n=1 Tax=Lactobacillus sp. ESL0228 TaxID=2069352 RepID=UPI000EFB9746|nr:alpha/beta hydrolase [Lactobacillus sp. ESL0228]RMC52098.1 alpha/beta hydrolase [Lactobacillus sp. ESL0228]
MKKSKTTFISLALIIILIFSGFLFYNFLQEKDASSQIATPTIFFHGWGSSYHAEENMVRYAQEHGWTNSIIRADVSPNGHVTLIGTIKKSAKNPIVEANLLNNRSVSSKTTNQEIALSKSSSYVKDVIIALQKKYHFKKINLVGHSMGNLQIAYYLRDNADNSKLPVLNKQVSIAGHYNGYIGESGAPTHTQLNHNGSPKVMDTGYRGLLSLRHKFPKNARVLNIYGNAGHGSDGSVEVNSARSYRYLVIPRVRSYQEKEIVGSQAQHSKLHENNLVNQLLVNFLWSK